MTQTPQTSAPKVTKSDAEWRDQLGPSAYAVLREAAPDRPFVGEYTDNKTVGVYKCRACDAELFRSDGKFDSHCGWPSFYAPAAGDRVRLIEDSREAFNISSAVVTLGAKAHFNTFGMTTGSNVSRYQATIAFAGEGSRVETNGVNLLNGRQHADSTLFLDHAVPNCASREIFRSVLDDRGHSVFQGRIIVRPHAQKTDAKMMSRALLLSENAEADNKPELEICADDVQCGHGATAHFGPPSAILCRDSPPQT